MAKQRKSKYSVEFSTLKNYTNDELKAYIRGGSKVISSRMSQIRKSPYADYSKSLERYDNLRKTGGVFEHGFKTKGLDRPELRKLANYVNSTITGMDTLAYLRDYDVMVQSLDGIFSKTNFSEAQALWEQLVNDNFDMIKSYVSENIESWISYVGSDGVNDVFNINDYATEEEQYIDLFKRMKSDYNKKKLKEAAWGIREQRKDMGRVQPETIRKMRYKGKFGK